MENEKEEVKFLSIMNRATSVDREMVLEALIQGLNACLPGKILKSNIQVNGNEKKISIYKDTLEMSDISEIIIVGGGKATALMCLEVVKIIGDTLPIKGVVNIPEGQEIPDELSDPNFPVKLIFASHPIPNEEGVKGVELMFDLIEKSSEKALVICLISGGGSALMTYPMPPLELPDLREMNKLLLKCGAEIAEINTIRKHLDGFKGGRLSKKIFPRRGFGLILSDVIGDPLEIIASGPTVPDPSTYSDVDRIMKKYELHDKIPKNIASILNDGLSGKIPETPKDTDPCFKSMTNILIGSALLAEQTYEGYFEAKEIPSKKIETMEGEALDFGKKLANRLYSQDMTKNITKQICYISSGEFTVTLTGNGVGGRNQEMLLGFLIEECKTMIENPEKYNEFGENYRYTFTSCAFDGLEGNSETMGAIIDSATLGRICDLLNAKNDDQILKYLEDTAKNNNSYELFSKLNDALVVGYTGTNVNDSLLLLITKN